MTSTPLTLLDHDIAPGLHLWVVSLDCYADRFGLEGLPAAGYEEAARLALPASGRRLLARRHAVRQVLGEAAGCAPESVSIIRDRRGRPRLEGGAIDFSLSASGGTALIGIRESGRVGVDVETLRPVPESEGLVRSHWTAEEAAQWRGSDTADRDRVFLGCWTRKEAVAKALGLGAAMSFQATHVGSSGVTTVRPEQCVARRALTVYSLELPDPLIGALALTQPPER